MKKFILSPSVSLLMVTLVTLSTGSQLISSNPVHQTTNANAYAQLATHYLPGNQAGGYMAQAASSVQQHPAIVTQGPPMLASQGPVIQQIATAKAHTNQIQPVQPVKTVKVLTPAPAPAPVPAPTMVANQQPVAISSMPVDDLLRQLTMSSVQTGGSNANFNHHVANVKIGNHETSTINHINHNSGTSISGSHLNNEVGHRNVNGPVQDFGQGNVNSAYAPVSSHSPQQGQYKHKATREQKELKARLLDLAKRITTNTPDTVNPDESIIKVNRRTGAMTPLQVDPNTAMNKAKLHNALRALSSKKLPVDRLRAALGDELQSEPDYLHQLVEPQEVRDYTPLPEELELEPADESGTDALAPAEENVVEEVRFQLDDRINRISDLLYFRPEFMNQLLYIEDKRELSPVESEFKRMVLCNSDEQFCGQDLSQWAQRRQAEIMAEPPAAVEFVPAEQVQEQELEDAGEELGEEGEELPYETVEEPLDGSYEPVQAVGGQLLSQPTQYFVQPSKDGASGYRLVSTEPAQAQQRRNHLARPQQQQQQQQRQRQPQRKQQQVQVQVKPAGFQGSRQQQQQQGRQANSGQIRAKRVQRQQHTGQQQRQRLM